MSKDTKKAREFWIERGDEGYVCATAWNRKIERHNTEVIHTREVLPNELTPEQAIEKVCAFLRSDEWKDERFKPVANFLEANKDRILGGK